MHNATNEQTFTPQIQLGLDQTWTLASNAGALRLSGNIDLAGRTLTINAARTTGNGNIVDGNFNGSGALIKTGAGILTLGATGSTFTGGTTINAGVLAFSNGGAFGTGNITLAGGELRATVATTLARTVTVGGGASGTIAAANGANLTLNALAVYGDLALGSAGNAGTITMNLNTFVGSADSGTLSINAGTVRLATSAFGFITSDQARTTIAAGATLDLNNFSLAINNLQGAGSLVMNSSGGLAPDAGDGSSAILTLNSGDFSGTISGYGNIFKDTIGTLILSGANTFSQGVVLNQGSIGVGHNSALGSGYLRVTGAAALFAQGGDRVVNQAVHLDSGRAHDRRRSGPGASIDARRRNHRRGRLDQNRRRHSRADEQQ
jgi:autotransporter-associated beta strand protein